MNTHIVKEITRLPLVAASERKGIIGGSQVGVLAGLKNCYSSIHRVWREYIGMPEVVTEQMKESFDAGNRFEEWISQWFGDLTKTKPHELDYMYCDPDNHKLVLHPDREFEVDGKRYALECKTASTYSMMTDKWCDPVEIDRNKLPAWFPKELKCFDGNTLMSGYWAQCLWYYALAGYEGVFLGRITDNRLYIYFVEPDIAKENFLRNKANEWVSKFDSGYVAPPEDSDEVKSFYPVDDGNTLKADKDLEDLISKYKTACDYADKATEEAETLKVEIQNKMGTNQKIVSSEDVPLITWKTSYKVDEEKVKALIPDWEKKYTKTKVVMDTDKVKEIKNWEENLSKSERRFSICKEKKPKTAKVASATVAN